VRAIDPRVDNLTNIYIRLQGWQDFLLQPITSESDAEICVGFLDPFGRNAYQAKLAFNAGKTHGRIA
jgi:hypothetical protein